MSELTASNRLAIKVSTAYNVWRSTSYKYKATQLRNWESEVRGEAQLAVTAAATAIAIAIAIAIAEVSQ